MLDANLESFENLRQNLEANEIDPDEIPMVLQYNKRDLPNALPIEILNERLNPRGRPFYEAVAVKGVGVEETLKGVTKLVFQSLSVKYGGRSALAFGARQGARPCHGADARRVDRARTAAGRAVDRRPAERARARGARLRGLPAIEVDENTPVGAPSVAAVRAAMTPRPPTGRRRAADTRAGTAGAAAAPRALPPPPARPGGPAAAPPRPQQTLQTRRDEATELRRAISAPGMPSDELEMDLEEIHELEHPTHGPGRARTAPPRRRRPSRSSIPTRAPPRSRCRSTSRVAPGTTRVSLNVRLVLQPAPPLGQSEAPAGAAKADRPLHVLVVAPSTRRRPRSRRGSFVNVWSKEGSVLRARVSGRGARQHVVLHVRDA